MPKKTTSTSEKARRRASAEKHLRAVPEPEATVLAADTAPEWTPEWTPPSARDTRELAKFITWARSQALPVVRVKIGEAEVELGLPLTAPPPPPSGPRTRMAPPTGADADNIYAEYGGDVLRRAAEKLGYDPEEEDDDEPAIPAPRPRRHR
jgi:hypothetical protein